MTTDHARAARVGLVDVGSNAVRTRIVEADGTHTKVLHEERFAIRVGREVFVSGALTQDTIAAVADVLGRFRGVCDRLGVGTIRAVATAAARAARNGPELCVAAQAAGVDLQIIDGGREAELLHAAVDHRVALPTRSVLVDLGAGSLEIVVVVAHAVVSAASYPLGSLLLLEALDARDRGRLGPPLLAAIDALIEARAAAAAAQLDGIGAARLVGVGSSIDVVDDLESAAGRGHSIDGVAAVTSAALHGWRTRLAAIPAAERAHKYGLTADRADLVVVAISVFHWLLGRVALDAVVVPRVSLRDGLLAQWLAERQ